MLVGGGGCGGDACVCVCVGGGGGGGGIVGGVKSSQVKSKFSLMMDH